MSDETIDLAIRALRRDINFAHEMATVYFSKHGTFSSVDKGNAAQDYAKRCEAAIADLRERAKTIA